MESERKHGRSSRLRFVALIAVFVFAYWWISRPAESAIAWETDFDVAASSARDKNLPMFVDFYADWCGPCLMLDAQVLSSERIAAAVHERFVPVRIDLTNRASGSRNEQVAAQYGVQGIPAIMVIDPSTLRVIARAGDNAYDVEGMLAFLNANGG